MRHVDEFEIMDKQALITALLELKICPGCRADLKVVGLYADVWGCAKCKETFYLPKMEKENERD